MLKKKANKINKVVNFSDIVKQANLSVLTVWLGRLVKLSETGEYEWNDGSVGRHSEGFKGGEPLSAKFYFDCNCIFISAFS